MSTTRVHSNRRVRTRVLRPPQSHNGCFTCKIRRVRCDLSRPVCDRCMKAGRICRGYRDLITDWGAVVLQIQSPLFSPPGTYGEINCDWLEISCLVKLGCEVLYDGSIQQRGAATSFWSMIPQLGQTDPLVGVSMATFGAAIAVCLCPSVSGAVTYSRQCGFALRSIQQAIMDSMNSSLALIAACLLLAVSEMLMGQELPALSHLQGTLLVLQHRQRTPTRSSSETLYPGIKPSFDLLDEVDTAGAVLDIGTASYALGLEPRLPSLTTGISNSRFLEDFSVLERLSLKTIHSSYGFASKHYHWRYVPNKFIPKEAFICQNELCTDLFQRIQELERMLANSQTGQASPAAILRTQCSACLIYVQMLLEPLETGYDRFQASFNSILEDAETFVSSYQPLSPRAVDLLKKTGREGPFDGRSLSVVAQRAVDLETETSNWIIGGGSELNNPNLVPERFRLHSAGVDSTHPSATFAMMVPASFSRCEDVESLLEAASADEYKDPCHWKMWNELLPWSGESRPSE